MLSQIQKRGYRIGITILRWLETLNNWIRTNGNWANLRNFLAKLPPWLKTNKFPSGRCCEPLDFWSPGHLPQRFAIHRAKPVGADPPTALLTRKGKPIFLLGTCIGSFSVRFTQSLSHVTFRKEQSRTSERAGNPWSGATGRKRQGALP